MEATRVDSTLVRSLRREILEAVGKAKGCETPEVYVLSWEGFCGSPTNGYLNAACLAEMLRESTAEFDTRVVVYLRRQDTFIESMYTQVIQQGESLSFEDFLAGFRDPASLDYERILDAFASVFGHDHVVARSYDNARESGGVINDFGRILNSRTLQQFELRTRLNVSYSRTALEIARACNPHLDATQRQHLRYVLQAVCPMRQESSFQLLNNTQRAKMFARFAASNRRVARRMTSRGDQSLFQPVDCSTTGQFGNLSHVSPKDVAPLVNYLLTQLTTTTGGGPGSKIRKSQRLVRELRRVVRKLTPATWKRAA
jgi:hypothetical protein